MHCVKQETLPVKYAKGFTVDYYNGFKLITVKDWKDSSKIFAQYILRKKGKPAPLEFPDAVLLDTPIRKAICIATNQTAMFDRLNLTDSLCGVTNGDLIFNKEILQRIKAGKILNLGSAEVDCEKIAELNPSFVLTGGAYDGGDKLQPKLEALKVKMVLDYDYREEEPLARAEWLKFIAAFYDCEFLADSIFNEIEKRYLAFKKEAALNEFKPTVFCNTPFKEIWYMPSGETYIAKLIADAGGNFLWSNAKSTNGLNLSLDFDAVYNKAADADVWLNTGSIHSLAELKNANVRNTFFKAYKTKMIFNYDARATTSGGIDWWESGSVNPDKTLSDLIEILHPEYANRNELYYYRQLK